jgi:hypothetical protein
VDRKSREDTKHPTPVNDLINNLCKVMLRVTVTSSGLVEVNLDFPKLRLAELNTKKRKQADANTAAFKMNSWFKPQSRFAHTLHGPRKKGVCTCGAEKYETSNRPLCLCLY